jgi:ABC-2 type transport system permease protein
MSRFFTISALIRKVNNNFHLYAVASPILLILLSMFTAIISASSRRLGIILKEIGSLAAVVTRLQLPITLLADAILRPYIEPK